MEVDVVTSLAGGILTGVICGMLYKKKRNQPDQTETNNNCVSKIVIPEPNLSYRKELKIVVGIRTDMKLSLPEMASCLSDVVIKTFINSILNKSPYVGNWYYLGQAKVCTKVQNPQMMEDLIKKAEENNVIYETLQYKGQTAAFAAGPAPVDEVDIVTRHLKLL